MTNLEKWALTVAVRARRTGRDVITVARESARKRRRAAIVTTGEEVRS